MHATLIIKSADLSHSECCHHSMLVILPLDCVDVCRPSHQRLCTICADLQMCNHQCRSLEAAK